MAGKEGKVFSPKLCSLFTIGFKRLNGCKINGVHLPFASFIRSLRLFPSFGGVRGGHKSFDHFTLPTLPGPANK